MIKEGDLVVVRVDNNTNYLTLASCDEFEATYGMAVRVNGLSIQYSVAFVRKITVNGNLTVMTTETPF